MTFKDLKNMCPYEVYQADEGTTEKLRNILPIISGGHVVMDEDSPVGVNESMKLFFYFRNEELTASDFAVLEPRPSIQLN